MRNVGKRLKVCTHCREVIGPDDRYDSHLGFEYHATCFARIGEGAVSAPVDIGALARAIARVEASTHAFRNRVGT